MVRLTGADGNGGGLRADAGTCQPHQNHNWAGEGWELGRDTFKPCRKQDGWERGEVKGEGGHSQPQ